MEGFWTFEFHGVQGMSTGVITLAGGYIFGGNTSFLYKGTYSAHGNQIIAQVQIHRYAPGPSVMGRDQFALELCGVMQGSTGSLVAQVPGTPLKFPATVTKHGDLPARG